MRSPVLATVIVLGLAAGGLGYAAATRTGSDAADEVEPIVVPREQPDRGEQRELESDRRERDRRRRTERKQRRRDERDRRKDRRRNDLRRDAPSGASGFRPPPHPPDGGRGADPSPVPAPPAPERDDDGSDQDDDGSDGSD